MDKAYNHKKVEDKIYKMWEEGGYFKPEVNPEGTPFSIILPPPNANAPLHFGHAMYILEDILTRYHRMKGDKTLWLPGADHAGFETQFVFEKHLANEGKSRFDYDRDTLFQMIWEFVQNNRGGMEGQLKKLGFSLDWSRLKFTLDPDIVKIVYETFERLYDDGLIYRAFALVNYCTFDGTSFSDLEVVSEETTGDLYQIRYEIKDGEGSDEFIPEGKNFLTDKFITVATTRPETMFGDVAIMVNPKDDRYKDKIGKIALIPLINKEIPIISDESVDMEFGTGAVKVTPSHDFNDYEVARRNKLPLGSQIIGFDGKMMNTGVVDGLYAKQARKEVIEKLKEIDALGETTNHSMVLRKCYKCKNILEPLPMEQWFVATKPLAEKAIKAIEKEIGIYPERFENVALEFLENIRDWNISRQIVWGIRIPAYFRSWKPTKELYVMGFHERTVEQIYNGKTATYRLRSHGLKEEEKFALENSQNEEIFGYGTIQKIEVKTVKNIDLKNPKHGVKYEKVEDLIEALQFHHSDVKVTENTKVWVYTYSFGKLENGEVQEVFIGESPNGEGWKQDTDTFDTWFSSAQWPFATLKTTKRGDFETFYPTSVMETGYDILRWWVVRMIMLGIYATGEVPFKNVVLHGLVNDPLGKKMSKSKGNVINPLELVEEYGADSVRFALVYGTALGNDQVLSYPKLAAARKFANKIWNMGRFIEMNRIQNGRTVLLSQVRELEFKIQNLEQLSSRSVQNKTDREEIEKVKKLAEDITNLLDHYNFNEAAQKLYEFTWHEFADIYIEDVKKRIDQESLSTLASLYVVLLKLLHPFMPFITEEVFESMKFGEKPLIVERWPL